MPLAGSSKMEIGFNNLVINKFNLVFQVIQRLYGSLAEWFKASDLGCIDQNL